MSNDQFNQHNGNFERSKVPDRVSIHIDKMLRSVPRDLPYHTIFKVRHRLREVNEKAYEPVILAIGPYNYGNNKFKFMEEQKVRYMQRLLERKNEGSVERYVPTLRNLEQRARNCYAENIKLSQQKFIAMMLIDGCFIVEWFRKYIVEEMRDRDDPILRSVGIRLGIRRDLLLLENQLPLFILSDLYDLTKGPDETLKLTDLATMYFRFELEQRDPSRSSTSLKYDHLLHLYHTWRTSGNPKERQPDCIKLRFPATELKESGVSFKVVQCSDVRSIDFKKGTLEIPLLKVEDDTESIFRNLIAFEQHHESRDITYFTDYVAFMDCLINSSQDVKVLRREKIIENYLGDDEVVAQMFNKIGDCVNLSSFCYNKTCDSLNGHCSRKMNIWMANLRKKYFSGPWAFCSVLAAIVLLLLTVAQTVFAILSYTKQT